MQRSQGFQVKRVQEVGNKAGSQAKSRAVNRGTSWSPEFDAIIKYFREDLLIPTTVVSKNMWKREKIGSTIRIGPDNILPFIKIDKESMNKIILSLMKEHSKSSGIIDFEPFSWLLDRSFKLGPDNEQTHFFSSKEIDSEKLKTKSSFSLHSLKIDVIASKKEYDHLPSKNLKKMLNELWNYFDISEEDNLNFKTIQNKGDIIEHKIQKLLWMETIFPYEFAKSWLLLFFDDNESWLKTSFYSILPNITYDFYSIKPNNYSLSNFKSLLGSKIWENFNNSTKQTQKLKWGFLKLNKKNLVSPLDESDSIEDSNWIGIWMANIPQLDWESKLKSNPYVWAAWTKFILSRAIFQKSYSPSSDKNTFLLCSFDEKNFEGSIEFSEFKIVQNNPAQKQKAHNSWAVIESEKTLEWDENK